MSFTEPVYRRTLSVHVRSMIEDIDDCHCWENEVNDHAKCLLLWEAAHWPEPAYHHRLDTRVVDVEDSP